MQNSNFETDISASIGAPFGGFGTGSFVYGRYGFLHWNVNGYPEPKQCKEYPFGKEWYYYADDKQEAPFALSLTKNGKKHLLQTRPCAFAEGIPAYDFSMTARMPLCTA